MNRRPILIKTLATIVFGSMLMFANAQKNPTLGMSIDEYDAVDEYSNLIPSDPVLKAAEYNCNKPKPGWADSYSVNGKCYCATTYDHNIGGIKVNTPAGKKTVKEVCQKIGKGPGKKGNPVYNTVQCGHAPYNNAGDEDPGCCPGRVDQGAKGCDVLGPKWDLSVFGGGGGGTKPATPSGLTATVNACSVALTWKDNADNEAGYNVRRKVVGGTFETVAVLTANSKSYTDNTVKANTNYEYRAQAFNDAGAAGSNIVKASVKSCGGGGGTVEINVTLVETDCNKKGKTRNKIFFTVDGSSAKPNVNKGFIVNKGGNNWMLRHVGTPKGSTTNYVITVGDAVHEEPVTAVKSCTQSAFSSSSIENNNLNAVAIYPNPASDQVTLLLNGKENVRIQLMNISGQVVFDQVVETNMLNISLTDYMPGTYMFKITDNANTSIRKFVIK